MSHPLFDQHQPKLDQARQAIRTRGYWSGYPEVPSGKIYGENAKAAGEQAFKQRLGEPYEMDHPGALGGVGEEVSPYGFPLGIKYPRVDAGALVASAKSAMIPWREAGHEARVGVCLEILHRLNQRSFEIANAVMHTTGQGFMMAFQAGGPHAQDRALEAIAYACEELERTPAAAVWTKQVSKTDAITLEKIYHVVPRGVALNIGCSTFPTWNSYPGLFASLVTGNAVIVKPHPGAILPLALTVDVAREVLREQGLDPNLVTLAADAPDRPLTQELASHPDVRIIDYTGSSSFGTWLEQNARQAVVYTEKAGVNSIILDSVADLKPVAANLAFSLSLYSGQMCTTPQNIFIPRGGIRAGGATLPFDDAAAALVQAIDGLLGEPARATEVLGAIQNERTLQRIGQAASEGAPVLRPSTAMRHEQFPEARVRSPLILKAAAADERLYMREMFGPISYVIATDDTPHSISLAARAAREHGAITCGLYSTDGKVLSQAEQQLTDAGAPVSCNLTGPIYVNQAAAFSDFHVSGCNPSGNATLTDAAFVAGRFRIVQSRRPAR